MSARVNNPSDRAGAKAASRALVVRLGAMALRGCVARAAGVIQFSRAYRFTALLPVLALSHPLIAQGPTEITLRAVSRLEESRAIALRDIARITGPQAEILAGVVILSAPEDSRTWITITPEQVRRAIDEAATVNWGLITITGTSCALRVLAARETVDGMATASGAAGSTGVSPALDSATLRARVLHRLAGILGCEIDDLRATFDARDESLLAMRVEGLVTEIESIGRSGRLALRITVYDRDRIVTHQTIDVKAEVRQTVAIARAPLRRGEVIAAGDVTFEARWLSSILKPAAGEHIVGSAARSHIQAGQMILDRDVQAPFVVSRGDVVSVHVVSGSLVVESRARALSAGRDGEIVEFESLDPNPRERSRFKARMNGRGRAVMMAQTTAVAPSSDTATSTAQARVGASREVIP